MSTEATGDGGPDPVGATERETAVLSGPAPENEAADVAEDASRPENAGRTKDADRAGTPRDADDSADSDVDDEDELHRDELDRDERELDRDEPDGDDERYDEGDEEPGDYEDEYEDYDGEDGDYPEDGGPADLIERAELVELDLAAQERPARRWPRVLLAFGFVLLALAIVGGAVAIVGSVTHGFKKPVKVVEKKAAVFSLRTGDCFDPQGDQSYTRVSCNSAHVAEVFATFALSGTKWPGVSTLAAQASSGCATRLASYLNPELAISLASTYVYPDSVAWQTGTRTVICEVRASSGDLTGSVRGASASAGTPSAGTPSAGTPSVG